MTVSAFNDGDFPRTARRERHHRVFKLACRIGSESDGSAFSRAADVKVAAMRARAAQRAGRLACAVMAM